MVLNLKNVDILIIPFSLELPTENWKSHQRPKIIFIGAMKLFTPPEY